MNNLQDFAGVFEGINPWAGQVPQGYIVDCFGVLTAAKYLPLLIDSPAEAGGDFQQTRFPTIEEGEIWFCGGQLGRGGSRCKRSFFNGYARRELWRTGCRKLPCATDRKPDAL